MLEFRSAHLSDFDGILKLRREIHSSHVAHASDFYRNVQDPLTAEEFADVLEQKQDSRAYVLMDNDKILGYAFVKFLEMKGNPLIYDQKQLFIDDMCIEAKSKRKGYGTRLMKELRLVAVQSGCRSIELNVWDWNREAVLFYKALGMEPTRLRMKMDIESH
jgi:ribosomal protein S18 acetylase RimI-like enzyme